MTTKQSPQTRVDLDLDALQGAGKTLRFRGNVLQLPAEIDIPTINRAIMLTALMQEGDESPTAGLEMLNEMKALVEDVLRRENPDMPDDLPWGLDSLSRVLGMLITGRPDISLEDAVAETLLPPGYEDAAPGGENGEASPPTKPKRPSGSRSAKRSPAASST